jgi:hypothetical protein
MVDKRVKYPQCPKNRDFLIEQYIRLGKSTTTIAKEFGFCRGSVGAILRKMKLIRSVSESVRTIKNSQWKGDKVGYISLHEWIRNRKPKPLLCEECNKNKPYDLANISGEYKRDINDFEWICRSCHMHKDGRINNLKRGTKNGYKIL